MSCINLLKCLFECEKKIVGQENLPGQENSGANAADPNKKVDIKDFHFLKTLGAGGFGQVFLVKKKIGQDAGKWYAMKMMLKKDFDDNLYKSYIERDVLIRSQSCPFIIQLYYSFQCTKAVCLVLDYIPGTDMNMQMILHDKNVFSEEETQFYIGELAVALGFLHVRGITHRDIKLDNILLAPDGHIKLSDFGLSKEFLSVEMYYNMLRSYSCVGTLDYMAPELFHPDVDLIGYSFSIDWWSVGVIMFRLTTGYLPFSVNVNNPSKPLSREAVINQIKNYEPTLPNSSAELAHLVSVLLDKNPERRVRGRELGGAYMLTQHPFFRETNDFTWDRLINKQIQPPLIPIEVYDRELVEESDYYSVKYERRTRCRHLNFPHFSYNFNW